MSRCLNSIIHMGKVEFALHVRWGIFFLLWTTKLTDNLNSATQDAVISIRNDSLPLPLVLCSVKGNTDVGLLILKSQTCSSSGHLTIKIFLTIEIPNEHD